MKPNETGATFRPGVIGIAGMYLGLTALVFLLAFCNLDGRPFWGDEAETALLARNVLKFGVPKVDDGVNRISLHGDKFDARDGVWTWSPWLQDYIAAGSFAVFGETTWAGRAPFAFIGWLSVVVLGFVAWRIYRTHRIALSAMLLLGTSEVFLLHIRQCRYYSVTVLAEVVLVYGIYQILMSRMVRGSSLGRPESTLTSDCAGLRRDKPTLSPRRGGMVARLLATMDSSPGSKGGGAWFIFAALLVQFYCNYTCALANFPILLVLAFRLSRQDRSALVRLVLCFGIFLLFAVPWLLFAETWRQGSAEGHDTWVHLIRFYAWQFHFHFFPWCFVLLPILGWLSVRFGRSIAHVPPGMRAGTAQCAVPTFARLEAAVTGRQDTCPTGFACFEKYLLGLMILYVPVLLVMPLAFSRYLLPLLPIVCLLVAVWLFRYIKWTALVCIILMVQCLTNVLAVATDPFSKQNPVRSPIADVLFSSLLPYEDRLTDLVKFFGDRAQPGDTLLSWDPEFPLAFYTHLKVIDGRLTPDPFHPLPDWILPESATGDLNEKHELPDALKSRYEKIILTVHNSTQVDTIPEPEAYELQTAASMAPFVIYKLKNEN